ICFHQRPRHSKHSAISIGSEGITAGRWIFTMRLHAHIARRAWRLPIANFWTSALHYFFKWDSSPRLNETARCTTRPGAEARQQNGRPRLSLEDALRWRPVEQMPPKLRLSKQWSSRAPTSFIILKPARLHRSLDCFGRQTGRMTLWLYLLALSSCRFDLIIRTSFRRRPTTRRRCSARRLNQASPPSTYRGWSPTKQEPGKRAV